LENTVKNLHLALQNYLNDVAFAYHMTKKYDGKIEALQELDNTVDAGFEALSYAFDLGNLTDTKVRVLAKQAVTDSKFDNDSQEITTEPNLGALIDDIRETA